MREPLSTMRKMTEDEERVERVVDGVKPRGTDRISAFFGLLVLAVIVVIAVWAFLLILIFLT